jgi:UDP-GlcNAc3NAcA epimerase
VDLTGLLVIDPVGYLDMTALLHGCRRTLTESDGLQTEAYFHRKPCVTLRDATERVETVDAGCNRSWRGPGYAERRTIDVYGDGHAAEKIADTLVREA